jgi:hypothetical protein
LAKMPINPLASAVRAVTLLAARIRGCVGEVMSSAGPAVGRAAAMGLA